jgi:hypothetical protein
VNLPLTVRTDPMKCSNYASLGKFLNLKFFAATAVEKSSATGIAFSQT